MNQRTASTLSEPSCLAPGGSAAVPLGDEVSDKLNRALVTVLTFYLTTGFNLTATEVDLVAERLDTLLTPLRGRECSHIPIAVVHEMATGQYQAMVDDHAGKQHTHPPGLDSTRVADWIDMFLRLVGETYRLDPARELALTGQFAALMRHLGVDDGSRRGAQYLPTMIAEIVSQRLAAGSANPPWSA